MPYLVSLTRTSEPFSSSSCTQSCTQEGICKQAENVLRASLRIVSGLPTVRELVGSVNTAAAKPFRRR